MSNLVKMNASALVGSLAQEDLYEVFKAAAKSFENYRQKATEDAIHFKARAEVLEAENEKLKISNSNNVKPYEYSRTPSSNLKDTAIFKEMETRLIFCRMHLNLLAGEENLTPLEKNFLISGELSNTVKSIRTRNPKIGVAEAKKIAEKFLQSESKNGNEDVNKILAANFETGKETAADVTSSGNKLIPFLSSVDDEEPVAISKEVLQKYPLNANEIALCESKRFLQAAYCLENRAKIPPILAVSIIDSCYPQQSVGEEIAPTSGIILSENSKPNNLLDMIPDGMM